MTSVADMALNHSLTHSLIVPVACDTCMEFQEFSPDVKAVK